MTIDTGALRKFQEVWGPVLTAIPAVLDMVEREADLDRALNVKRVELEKAQKQIDSAFEEADKRLQAVNAEMTATMERSYKTQQEITEAKRKASVEAADAVAQKNATLTSLQAEITSTQSQLQGLQGEYANKRAAAEADHAQVVKAMNAEIADLEHRKAIAQAALDAIKAKLG